MSTRKRTAIAVTIFLAGVVTANMIASRFGPNAVPFVTFFFIGLDLSLRDFLQLTMKRWSMFSMIIAGGLISYLMFPEAGRIAVASASAFTFAALVDWTIFAIVRGRWILRANVSNAFGAVADSTMFMTLAFGAFMPVEIFTASLSKIAGGFVWSYVLAKFFQQSIASAEKQVDPSA